MSRAHHRLDLLLVPVPWQRRPDPAALPALLAAVAEDPSCLVIEGQGSVRLDEPGGRVLYSNNMGGVRVRCPDCGAPLARPFAAAVERWKQGEGEPEVACGCGSAHTIESLDCRPPVARGQGALVLADAGAAELAPGARDCVSAVVGAFTLVYRRS